MAMWFDPLNLCLFDIKLLASLHLITSAFCLIIELVNMISDPSWSISHEVDPCLLIHLS